MGIKSKLKHIYEHHYKKLLLIPILMVVLAFLQIGLQVVNTGDFVNKGISLKGGSTIIIDKEISMSTVELEQALQQQFPTGDISVRTISSAIAIDSDAKEEEEVQALTSTLQSLVALSPNDYSVEIVGSSLGESFFKQTGIALLVAFLLMSIVVSIYFRKLIPVVAVILATLSDLIVTLAVFNLTEMKLSTAGIAAFLMLIGYSVDNNILLTSRLLQRTEGSVMEKIYGALKTGLTMNATTLAAVLTALLLVNNETVKQIMLVLSICLIVDIIMTWIQNVGILRLYLEKKQKSKS